jgi:DUF971 family protein
MNIVPVKIEQPNVETLKIEWQDGHISEHAVSALRDACPCATCREKRRADSQPSSQLPVLTLEEAQPTRIETMKPVGNYAYAIHFNDGHDTGIFTLEFLRSFGGK